MIKYIGSKRVIVPHIASIVEALPDVSRVCDLFAGTTRVGQAIKKRGKYVVSNDTATYSEALGMAYVQADAKNVDMNRVSGLLKRLQSLPPRHGYFTRTFCEAARYFQPHNGMLVDAIRQEIDHMADGPEERAILLTSLLLAADRVDSTTGLQMAYLKEWAPRSYQALELRVPELLPGPGLALRRDANEIVRVLDDVDLVYVDPPYNQHSYFSNYHIWETLVRNDEPETYGIANKRVDCRVHKSAYNQKKVMRSAFSGLIADIRSKYLLVSFNDEGYLHAEDIRRMLSNRGYVAHVGLDFKRYVGAQIGIFNPQGEKVGAVSHLRNQEYLFLVGPTRHVVEDAVAAVRHATSWKQAMLLPAESAS